MRSVIKTAVLMGSLATANLACADDGWFCSKEGHQMDVSGNSVTEQHMNCEKEGGTWTRAVEKTESAPAPSMGGGGGW